MPVAVSLANTNNPGQPKMYNKYSLAEFYRLWNDRVECFTLEECSADPRYIIFHTSDKQEAAVVAALFIREFQLFPECTHYDEKLGILSLYYGAAGTSEYTDDEIREGTIDLITGLMRQGSIKFIIRDKWGYELFWGGMGYFFME